MSFKGIYTSRQINKIINKFFSFITEIKNLKKRSINEKSSLISKSGFQNQTGRSVGGRDEVNIKHMESIHENKKDSHKKNDVKKPKPRNLQVSNKI